MGEDFPDNPFPLQFTLFTSVAEDHVSVPMGHRNAVMNARRIVMNGWLGFTHRRGRQHHDAVGESDGRSVSGPGKRNFPPHIPGLTPFQRRTSKGAGAIGAGSPPLRPPIVKGGARRGGGVQGQAQRDCHRSNEKSASHKLWPEAAGASGNRRGMLVGRTPSRKRAGASASRQPDRRLRRMNLCLPPGEYLRSGDA